MEERTDYSYDTGKIRDVANTELARMVDDVESVEGHFGGLGGTASEAFSAQRAWFGYGDSPFTALGEKWAEASAGIIASLAISRGRIDSAAEGLRQTADDYDEIDAQAAAEFGKLLRAIDESAR